MVLHTVNKNHPLPALASCLKTATLGSTILLIENGVYNASVGSAGAKLVQGAPHLVIRLLEADVLSRGLQQRLIDNCKIITDAEFVALVAENDKMVAWF